MRRRNFDIMECSKKLLLTVLVLLATTVFSLAQELELVDLGVIEGEFKNFKRTLSWKNDSNDSILIKQWSDSPDLQFKPIEHSIAAGEEIELPITIELSGEAGDYEFELRLLDKNDFVLHGFQMTFKVLQSELDVFKAYRNVYWPFRTKEEVFNLKVGKRGDELTASFDVYNLGGKDLDLSNVLVSDSIQIDFEPKVIPHNQFGRMKISFKSRSLSKIGFTREVLKLYQKDKLISVLPVQYTLLPKTSTGVNGPRLSTSKVNHDFKVVKVNEVREVSISLANNGSKPLKIERIESNCDCLTFNKIEAITPGKSKELRVTFNATGRIGLEKKTIAIFSNDPRKPVRVLTFRAHVK